MVFRRATPAALRSANVSFYCTLFTHFWLRTRCCNVVKRRSKRISDGEVIRIGRGIEFANRAMVRIHGHLLLFSVSQSCRLGIDNEGAQGPDFEFLRLVE